jgi:CheY-like chemotaxis protein
MSANRVCLVVDDEPRVRGYLRAVMQTGGFETIEADNGIHALEELRSCARHVDLMVSDVNMPLMNGHALASRVRSEFPTTAIVLITGYTATPASDGSPVLQKPFLPAVLLEAAAEALARWRGAAASG